MESKINLKPGRYSAKEYARFCEAGKQAYALLTSKVVFERMASKQTF
jgi:hypothetical protein